MTLILKTKKTVLANRIYSSFSISAREMAQAIWCAYQLLFSHTRTLAHRIVIRCVMPCCVLVCVVFYTSAMHTIQFQLSHKDCYCYANFYTLIQNNNIQLEFYVRTKSPLVSNWKCQGFSFRMYLVVCIFCTYKFCSTSDDHVVEKPI